MEGRVEGLMEGRAEGLVQAVIMLLAGRGVEVTDTARARIMAEGDVQRLGRWILRAASCATTAELFAGD